MTDRRRDWLPDGKEAGHAEATPTFGSVVLLLGALPRLPPLPLQDLQTVVLLELENGQRDLISVWRTWGRRGGR